MARLAPDTFRYTDADKSFVPSTYYIDSGSGTTNPPHGPADIAADVRHLFRFGHAGYLIAQPWLSSEAGYETVASFPANETARYRVPHDAAFTSFKVMIDYEANLNLSPGLRLNIEELAVSIDLDTVAAGGAVRRVTQAVWSPVGLDTYAGEYLTFRVYAKGNGSGTKNKIRGIWVKRIGYADIPAGTWYNGDFITPDSSAFLPDKPLTTDKMRDLRACILTLPIVRKKAFLVWSAVRNQASYSADSLLSVIGAIRPDRTMLNTLDFGWFKLGGGSAEAFGGFGGRASPDPYNASVSGSGWHDFTLALQYDDPIIRNASSDFQQIVIDPSLIPYLESVSVFGS